MTVAVCLRRAGLFTPPLEFPGAGGSVGAIRRVPTMIPGLGSATRRPAPAPAPRRTEPSPRPTPAPPRPLKVVRLRPSRS